VKINHIAIRTEDIEKVKAFYCRYFGMEAGPVYFNAKRQFTSYFLTLHGSDTRIEIINIKGLPINEITGFPGTGYAHIAISAGSMESVNELTDTLRSHGYIIRSGPRVTGDGYYESVILDPEGNEIEITV